MENQLTSNRELKKMILSMIKHTAYFVQTLDEIILGTSKLTTGSKYYEFAKAVKNKGYTHEDTVLLRNQLMQLHKNLRTLLFELKIKKLRDTISRNGGSTLSYDSLYTNEGVIYELHDLLLDYVLPQFVVYKDNKDVQDKKNIVDYKEMLMYLIHIIEELKGNRGTKHIEVL